MDIQTCFDKFYENIKLTRAQKKDAVSKYQGVCKKLHSHYYPEIEYNGNTKLLIGSYGKHTNIRPPRDVDVLFIMPGDKFKQYDDNESNGQSQLLQDIRDVLSERYSTTDEIKAWGKVVLIQFTDSKHSIELLPAWENDLIDGSFIIPNTANGGAWDEWYPRSEIKKIQESDANTNKTKKLIRMIKKWTENCTVQIKSYLIENAVVDFFSSNSSDENCSKLVVDFFGYFLSITSDEERRSHIQTAKNRSEKAYNYEIDGKLDDAVQEWKKIFGDDFPMLERSEKSFDMDLQELQESYPSQQEELLQEPIRINQQYQFKIDAYVEQKGWMKRLLVDMKLLRKSKKLTFFVAKNTVPPPFQLKWKVRNFGEEAKRAEQLRGEITLDEGKNQKIEHTRYWGQHYVECYVIKDEICVAYDRIFVPIGTAI